MAAGRLTRTGALSAVLAAGLLTGCASGRATASQAAQARPVAASSAAAMAGMATGGSRPTASALMVCGDDIKGKVRQVLRLSQEPTTRSTFADQLFTCTYQLPVGPLTLSVQHSADHARAIGYFTGLRAKLGRTEPLDGLGEQAYGTPTGVAVVVKDNETLMVDATKLPPVFGDQQQRRTDLANEIASDVLGCWTGDE